MKALNKKVLKGLGVGFIVVAIVFAALYGAGKVYFSDLNNIEKNWSVEFPKKTKVIYSNMLDEGFQGDGIRYYKLKLEDESFVKDFEAGEDSIIGEIIEEHMLDLFEKNNIPKEEQPDFTKPYKCRCIEHYLNDGSVLEMLYFEETGILYIYESII